MGLEGVAFSPIWENYCQIWLVNFCRDVGCAAASGGSKHCVVAMGLTLWRRSGERTMGCLCAPPPPTEWKPLPKPTPEVIDGLIEEIKKWWDDLPFWKKCLLGAGLALLIIALWPGAAAYIGAVLEALTGPAATAKALGV